VKEQAQHDHEDRGRRRREQIELAHHDAVDLEGRVGDAELEAVDLGSPQRLSEALEHEAEAERRHEQRDGRPIDERTQDDLLDREREHEHGHERDAERRPEAEATLDEAHERQRREEHHRALREVEDARGLVDEDEADGDHRVHDPGEQAAHEHLDEERHDYAAASSAPEATPR
jgi:hypothetical protein